MNEPIEGEELTPEQKQQWQDTMALMAWTCPGFRHIFYKLLANNNGNYVAVPTRQVPVAATDAKNILINPDEFFKMSLKERVFVIAHEIVHNVYGDVEMLHRLATSGRVPMHDGTSLPFDNDQFQQAMDYRINALLVESKIGQMPERGCYDPKVATGQDSVLDTYKKIYKKKPDNKGNGGFDKLLPPGKSTGQDPGTAAGNRNQQQWAVEVAAAQTLEQIRSQGKMAGALSRMFKEILEPKVPWTDHLRSIFARKIGAGSYNWRRPDRRFIVRDLHMPSRSGHGAGWIVVWGDTSGSIGPDELNKYLAELAGILEDVKPRRLTVVWCDAKIQRIDEIEEATDLYLIKHKGAPGGGGTDVKPVLDWIAGHTETPEVFIGFTDGYVSFPKKPPGYHTIWASVSDVKYPYGDVVNIK